MTMTKSKFKFYSLTTFAFLALLFTACEQSQDLDEGGHLSDQTQNFIGALTGTGIENNLDSTDMDVLCFEFQFPISVNFPRGTTTSFDSEDALWQAIDNWYESNPESEEDPGVVFPVSVKFEDGTTEAIADDEELCDLYYECYYEWEDEEEWEDDEEDEWEEECPEDYYELCFDIVFPISIQVGDITYTVTSFEAADSLVYALIDSMPQVDSFDINLVYPIDIILEDGTQQTLNSDEDLDDLEETCEDDHDEGLDFCFTIEYPITLLFPDSTTVVANSDADVETALDNWENNNPDNHQDIYPVFPVTVTVDSTAQVVETAEAFETLLDTCD